MKKTKLLQVLQTLSPAEFKRFNKFVQSPFYNTNPSVIKLYKVLKSAYPDFTSPRLEKEKVFKKIFPNKAFNYHHFANILSEMTHLAEEFITQLELESQPFQKRKIRMKALGKRNNYAFFEKETRALIEELNEQPYRDVTYLTEMMDLKRAFISHQSSPMYAVEEDFLRDMMNLLDEYFALSKLQLAVAMKTKAKIVSTDYDIQMLDAALQYSEVAISKNEGLTAIYAQILTLQEDPNRTDVFHSLKNQFLQNIEQLRFSEKVTIFQLLSNYCAQRINAGHFEFNYDFLELSKVGLAEKLLLNNSKIGIGRYLNIADVASVLKEFEWTEKFLVEYAEYLDKSLRSQTKALAFAKLQFRQGDYDAVLDTISQEHFSIVIFEANTRFLLIKTWFEKFLEDQSLHEFVLSKVIASEKFFIRKDVLSDIRTEGYINFLKSIKRLIKTKIQFSIDEADKKNLIAKIDSYPRVIGKVWLREKVSNF